MANSADPDQLTSSDLDLHYLQRQGISGFSRTRVNNIYSKYVTSRSLMQVGMVQHRISDSYLTSRQVLPSRGSGDIAF